MIKNSIVKGNTTNNTELSLINYDTNGAMIYMIVVILWYSIGVAFLLGMDMLTRSEEIEDSTRRRTRFLIRDLRDHTNTKEILEELVDKQKRDRLWDIYLGKKWDTKDCLALAENIRIRHIQKQLATIKRNHRLSHDTPYLSTNSTRYTRSHSDYPLEASQLSSKATSTHRRRSSLDHQTLEQWKELGSLSKPSEQFPWTIRKLMNRKYSRCTTKKASPSSRLKRSNTTIPTIDDEQTNLISFSNQCPKLLRGRTETDLSIITSTTINERQNPYTSYFYIPPPHPANFFHQNN